MWSSVMCLRSPIVLAFLMDHFLPLSCRSHNSKESSSKVYAIPLVTAAMEPLRVHFLLPAEENNAHVLLQQYLELTEVQAAGDSGCDAVLAAKIIMDDYRVSTPLTVRYMFQHHELMPKCTMEHCEFPKIGSRPTNGLCIVCTMGYPPYQSLVDDASRRCFEGVTLPQCANVGCFNESWLPYGGLCRLCSIGCYPRHYDMPFSVFINELMQRYTKYGTYY